MSRDRCIAKRTYEVTCDQSEVRSVDTIRIIDKDIPSERDFRMRVPIATDLGQPTTLLWFCDNYPSVRFLTAQEAAMLCSCEGCSRRGRLWVEVYEFCEGKKRQLPSMEWAYKVEMDPMSAEPVSMMLDYAGHPIDDEEED